MFRQSILVSQQVRHAYRHPSAPRYAMDSLCKRHYKLSAGAVKKGQIVEFKDKVWRVLNRDQSSSGRGSAVIKVELQDIKTMAKAQERFRSNDNLEVLNMQEDTYQYLYTDGEQVHVLHPETFDELVLTVNMCDGGERALAMLEDNMLVSVSLLTTSDEASKPVTFKLPQNHLYTVASVIERAGQAAKGTVFKAATLSNGAKLQVPEFVHEGDRIWVDIENLRYMKREL
ncbi:hypothetical protein DM01DRAFT_1335726 [Hesseltinella vesiculosa]|uniref:Translation elongation factor P n=1 Tax=Hesseltinella vesiculosa TaxID=101127 RepID=A0A1X2GIP6_9FUNG|nr:hypothetical protein DM01DRAFT_1335726 [Hesseltinella vesiculosa]